MISLEYLCHTVKLIKVVYVVMKEFFFFSSQLCSLFNKSNMRDVSNIIYIHLILSFKFDHFLDCIKLNFTNSKWGNRMHSDKALLINNQKQYKINGII